MSNFAVELWNSIFTPGVTPTLLKATYGSFALLICTLSTVLFFTRNVHVLALLILSCGLVASLSWFLAEVDKMKAAEAAQKEADSSKGASGGNEAKKDR
ncbi:SMK killer toxin resistance protein [Savitreella phatthalungensis]